MKRSILVVILIIAAVFGVYGQSVDLVLLLDTSSGMSSSYDKVNDYITGPFLSEFLRLGDTFHLIAYSGTPRLDLARRIQSRGDVETIVGRMLLQYPVENGNDARAAIAFAEQYISTLPDRPKKIIVVGSGDLSALVNASKQRLSSKNTTIDFVSVASGQPLTNLPNSGRSGTPAPSVQQRPSAPARQPSQPSSSSQPSTQTGTQSSSPAGTTTPSQTSQPGTTTPTQTSQPGTTSPAGTGRTPDSSTPSQTQTPSTPGTSQGTGTSPTDTRTSPGSDSGFGEQDPYSPGTSTSETAEGTPEPYSTDSSSGQPQDSTASKPPAPQKLKTSTGESWASSIPLIIGFIILALLILFLIIFFATRRLGSRPNRVMAAVSSSRHAPEKDDMAPFVDHSKDLASYAAAQNRQRSTPYTSKPIKPEVAKPAVINPSGPLLLNLFVEDQNTAIGKRNIHSLKSGYSLSVGGGKSDYYIFLVPIPSNIGEIRRNGSQCTFIPRKPKYFPDLGSNELRDCINKTIRIVSDKNYEIRFRFEMYEDPLIALNRILMSVKVPG